MDGAKENVGMLEGNPLIVGRGVIVGRTEGEIVAFGRGIDVGVDVWLESARVGRPEMRDGVDDIIGALVGNPVLLGAGDGNPVLLGAGDVVGEGDVIELGTVMFPSGSKTVGGAVTVTAGEFVIDGFEVESEDGIDDGGCRKMLLLGCWLGN